MKEIGEALQEARVSSGVTIEEAAEDLKLTVEQLENIEAGNDTYFKDVFYLKFFIRDYAKYLGLDASKLVDEFNEFLFDYTSRIPVEAIQKANKEIQKQERKKKKVAKDSNRIVSPYTLQQSRRFMIPPIVLYILIGIVIVAVVYMLLVKFGGKDEFVYHEKSGFPDMIHLKGGSYEFT